MEKSPENKERPNKSELAAQQRKVKEETARALGRAAINDTKKT